MDRLIIRNCTLIDGSGSDPRPNADVLIEGKAISRIAAAGSIREADAEELDASGHWLTPGLFNCHDHLYSKDLRYARPGRGIAALRRELNTVSDRSLLAIMARNAAQELYQGVTTVRDLGSPNQINIVMRDAIRNGHLPGPRVLACGSAISITGGHGWANNRQADGPDDCRKAVREQLRAGADVIKVMASGGMSNYPQESADEVQFSVEEMCAIVQEAHKRHRKTCAHANPAAVVKDCIRAGIDSIEHGIFLDEETVALMAQAGTHYVPTLSSPLRLGDPEYNRIAGTPDFTKVREEKDIRPRKESIRMAMRAGIKIGVASDSPGDVVVETQALAELGYDPMQALSAATRVSAEICGIADMVGTLEPGKLADLLVLEADPLEDLGNLSRIQYVVKEGKVVRKGPDLVLRPPSRMGAVTPPPLEQGWSPAWRPGW